MLTKETIIQILDVKQERERTGLGGSDRDIAERILGRRSQQTTVSMIWRNYLKHGHYRDCVPSGEQIAGGSKNCAIVEHNLFDDSIKRYVVTSAQCNTKLHDEWWNSIQNYIKRNNATLIVCPFYYNTKHNYQLKNKEDKEHWFDDRLKQYINNQRVRLAPDLVVCGELNISPTAVKPLSGLQNYTGSDSAIVPHAKLQLESLARPKYDAPKFMYTTGAVTLNNYIQQKAGQKATRHHTYGALIVEVADTGKWWVRQLNCDTSTGIVQDLGIVYYPDGTISYDNIAAINYGDLHCEQLDNDVAEASWRGLGSILDTLHPKYQFVNDALDMHRRNHHNIKNPHFMFNMYVNGCESVRDEVANTADVLCEMIRPFSEVVVVESNHDLALTKWLREADYKQDPVNAVFFLEMQLALYKAIAKKDKDFLLFEHACNTINPASQAIKFLHTDESFIVCGIENGQHGHNGVGGSRGSMNGFVKQGIKFNTAHSHSCQILDGVFYAGVSGKLDQGYNVGGSTWSHSHILTYNNGKRTIITLVDGSWCLDHYLEKYS